MSLLNFQQFTDRFRAGGPRQVQKLLGLDGPLGGDPLDSISRGGRRVNFNSIATLPKPIPPTPRETALALAGGLTLAQLDRAARFETAAGTPIGIYYGKILFALKLVSQLYEPGPGAGLPKNQFTGVIGEGWGGLGRHGEFNRIVKAYFAGQELASVFSYQIYVDDRTPLGATVSPDTDGWNWVKKNPTPYFGEYAHQSQNLSGVHQHFFSSATETMAIGPDAFLYCFIWIDPTNTPQSVMLQWQDGSGSFEHRAYWGANVFSVGTNGTNSRRQVSASVPTAGQWVRIQVPAADVGLEGQTVKGMAFTLFDGAATWDQAGRFNDSGVGVTPGYLLRPGIIARDRQDIQHPYDSLSGVGGNGSANVYVLLTEEQSAQNRPDAFKCIAECRKTFNYDATGAEIERDYSYAPSPARAVADRFLYFFQRRFRDRLDIAQERFRARIFWPSWTDWRDNSAQLIPWDREGDGVSVFTPRAEFHGGWTSEITMAQVLDEVCGQSFTGWQDDGQQVIFVPLSAQRSPVHHFHPGNIVAGGEPQRSTQPLSRTPNRVIIVGRDSEDEFLGEFKIEPPDDTPQHQLREDSISRVNEIRTERAVGGMTQSQGQRIAEFVARLLHDNPVRVSLVGNATAIHLLKWDLVTVSHPLLDWDSQLCLVLSATVRSAENSADEVEVTLQALNGDLDVDASHGPRQEALTL